jgi:hypothetical protein
MFFGKFSRKAGQNLPLVSLDRIGLSEKLRDKCNRFIKILILNRQKMCKQLFKTVEEYVSKVR